MNSEQGIKLTRTIEFDLAKVYNRFAMQLEQTTLTITHIFHSVQGYNKESLSPLQTHSLPIVLGKDDSEFGANLDPNNTLQWVFKKGFEDFIVGLTESLIETYKFAKLYRLATDSRGKQIFEEKDIEEKIEEINRRVLKLHFPALIDKIEKELNIIIPYKDEVLSINQVRNCLVHRNAMVSNKDINEKDCLILKYIDLVTICEIDGKDVELTWELKKKGFDTSRIEFHPKPKVVSYIKGEKIVMDQNIFNGISYTTLLFVQTLFELLHGKPR